LTDLGCHCERCLRSNPEKIFRLPRLIKNIRLAMTESEGLRM